MAGVLSRQYNIEEFREYFRKTWKRDKSFKQSSRSDSKSKCESLGILTGKPKYREYSTIRSRMDSFKNWPQGKTQKIEELVEAGFAYIGVDDAVRCYYCSVGLQDWPDGACPWKQHVIASPKCVHVILCKGNSFIRHILGERDEDSGSDVDDSNEVIDTVQLAIRRNESAVMVAREYCSNENILRMAVRSLIKEDCNRKFTAVELLEEMDDIKGVSESAEEEEKEEEETNEPNMESVKDVLETNRRLREPITCKICLDAIACIISLPCGHMVCCSQCISALIKCAVCRSEIKGTVRALMAV